LAPAINIVPFRIGARHRRMADPAIDLAFWRWRRCSLEVIFSIGFFLRIY
jgi:hypothetical protein